MKNDVKSLDMHLIIFYPLLNATTTSEASRNRHQQLRCVAINSRVD